MGMGMARITTLIPDIYQLMESSDGEVSTIEKRFGETFITGLSEEVSRRLTASFNRDASKVSLRLSKMGPSCPKALWYSLHHPELAEPLPPWAKIKFTYGHILEAMVLALAKEAGHEVVGEQDELSLLDVSGHRDCVIDGCTVDVKSCSSRVMDKFKRKTIEQDDPFGYLDQLDGYVVASSGDPLVRDKLHGYILAIDKTLGHLILYEHTVRPERIRRRIERVKQIFEYTQPPPCECGTRPEGNSGNIGLDVKASYSAYKHICFPHLRTFLYANGPKYLTQVIRTPDVPEINQKGILINANELSV
jgi:hypothetical protein